MIERSEQDRPLQVLHNPEYTPAPSLSYTYSGVVSSILRIHKACLHKSCAPRQEEAPQDLGAEQDQHSPV